MHGGMRLTVAGCVNIDGTTCFLNAALQALASSMVLMQHMIQLLERVQDRSAGGFGVRGALHGPASADWVTVLQETAPIAVAPAPARRTTRWWRQRGAIC